MTLIKILILSITTMIFSYADEAKQEKLTKEVYRKKLIKRHKELASRVGSLDTTGNLAKTYLTLTVIERELLELNTEEEENG
ncbi:hypothetical protein [Candidatus Odyssella acanthamoebae]|uniref:Uncharacterized protein n=1 Tax=Candidatus Odyssella acanthamoebae TaxID=91604 RepID=A0A077AV73_9PROT|nr:hypothetical protein [Candidatus Paracaedibacter acanthamoebae]AIK95924.1 hypothetical protein ID47_03000 [Candidatus Paracaedibacter acanthamoebae]